MDSLAQALPRPGLRFGPYPQRRAVARPLAWELAAHLADQLGHALLPWPAPAKARRKPWRSIARQSQQRAALQAADASTAPAAVRAALRRDGFADAAVAAALHCAARAVHSTLGLAPYEHQLLAAWAMLDGRLAELDTGTGKSIAILLAAAVAALAGVPVHVITANDYLAARDAAQAAQALAPLGLAVAAVDAGLDADARRAAYARDVVFATAREVGFDYLRDQLHAATPGAANAPVMRGLNLALIDEADSVLIDHARTPLVIAQPSAQGLEPAVLACVWQLSAQLRAGHDFVLRRERLAAEPAEAAIDWLHTALAQVPGASGDRRVSAQLLGQALVVRHLLERDRHYLLQAKADSGMTEHEVVLIDGTTGRPLPGTQWTHGLQQLVSVKEGCTPPPLNRVAEQITLQTLFSRYWRLGGTSGTLRESRLELFAFYRLGITRIEPRRPSRRQNVGVRVFADAKAGVDAVAASARQAAAAGRAVLVGTASVAACESLAAQLRERGMACQVIHAGDADAEGSERERVHAAGQPGVITVTTNKAGRGTDIAPAPAVLAVGGLHVINTALNASRRIDRQFIGRTARNGDPGSDEAILWLDNGAFREELPSFLHGALLTMARCNKALPSVIGRLLVRGLQEKLTWREFRLRWQMVEQDRRMRELLSHARGAL